MAADTYVHGSTTVVAKVAARLPSTAFPPAPARGQLPSKLGDDRLPTAHCLAITGGRSLAQAIGRNTAANASMRRSSGILYHHGKILQA